MLLREGGCVECVKYATRSLSARRINSWSLWRERWCAAGAERAALGHVINRGQGR
jgi:hypothetical protein